MSMKGHKGSVQSQRLALGMCRIKKKLEEVINEKQALLNTLESYCQKETFAAETLLREETGRMVVGSPAYQKAMRNLERCWENLYIFQNNVLEWMEGSDADEEGESTVEEYASCLGDNDRQSTSSLFTKNLNTEGSQKLQPEKQTVPIPSEKSKLLDAELQTQSYSPPRQKCSSLTMDNSSLQSEQQHATFPSEKSDHQNTELNSSDYPATKNNKTTNDSRCVSVSSSNASTHVSVPCSSIRDSATPFSDSYNPLLELQTFVQSVNSTQPKMSQLISFSSQSICSSRCHSSEPGRASSEPPKFKSGVKDSEITQVMQNLDIYVPPMSVGQNVPVFGESMFFIASCIRDPSDFYVKVDNPEMRHFYGLIKERLEQKDNPTGVSPLPAEHIPRLYGFYLSLFDSTPAWHRVQVLEVHPEVEEPFSWCLVFFVDHGYVKPVSFNCMGLLPEDLARIPLLAYNCCLDNAIPVGDNWGEDSLEVFTELANTNGLMGVFKNKLKSSRPSVNPNFCMESKYLVDLMVVGDCGTPIPLSFYMVISGLAATHTTKAEVVAKSGASTSSDSSTPCHKWNVQAAEFKINHVPAFNSDVTTTDSTLVKTAEDTTLVVSDQDCTLSTLTSDSPVTNDVDVQHHSVSRHPLLDNWTDELLTVSISHIENPSEFYVHLCNKSTELPLIDEQLEMLNEHFEKQETCPELPRPILKGSYWACQYPLDKMWYRVVIVKPVHPNNGAKPKRQPDNLELESNVLVQFVDWGNTIETTVSKLRPLTSEMCKLPSFAVPCSLWQMTPLQNQTSWSEQAKKRMEELLPMNELVTLHIRKQQPMGRLEVQLWMNKGEDVLLNDLLIKEGLAFQVQPLDRDGQRLQSDRTDCKTQGDNSSVGDNLPTKKEDHDAQFSNHNGNSMPAAEGENSVMDNWDPMNEEYNSIRNSYALDVDDAELAVTGHKSTNGVEVCQFYSMGRPCPRRDVCHFKHTLVTEDEEIGSLPNLMLPQPGSYVYATVSAVYNPGHFYLYFPYGCCHFRDINNEDLENEESLEALNKEMTRTYDNRQFLEDNTQPPVMGTLVAAQSVLNDRWYRAKIVGINKECTKFEVFFVDFGNEENVDRKRIRKLEPRFAHLPTQAVECIMDLEPVNGCSWTEKANAAFTKLVDGQVLLAKILSPWKDSPKSRVRLFLQVDRQIKDIASELVQPGLALKMDSSEDHSNYSFLPG